MVNMKSIAQPDSTQGLVNFIKRSYQSATGAFKHQAKATATPTAIPTQETLEVQPNAQGKAVASVNLNIPLTKQIKNWTELSQIGNKIPIKSQQSPENELIKIADQYYSPEQRRNLADFFNALLKQPPVLEQFRNDLKNNGITFEQLELIADASFTLEAYQTTKDLKR